MMTWSGFRRDERGVAAVETALVGSFLVVALFNVVEISRYAYLFMEVASASQAGAQAAIVRCDTSHTPVTINCPNAQADVTTAMRGTSLGSSITLVGGLSEGWYCVNGSGVLQFMSNAASKPANCGAAGDASTVPSLYLKLNAAYTYEPIFPGLTIAATFPPTITRTAWMRML